MKNILMGVLAIFILAGCNGIGEDIEKSTKNIEKKISNEKTQIKLKEKTFKSAPLTKEFENYVKKENLINKFNEARTQLDRSNKAYKSLKKIVDDNDNKNRNIALGKIKAINSLLKEVKNLYNYPEKRVNELKKAIDNAEEVNSKAIENVNYIENKQKEITKYLKNELKENNNTSRKVDDLNKDISTSKKISEQSKEALKVLNEEYKKGKSMDIALFVSKSKEIKKLKKDIDELEKTTNKKIDELNSSYTKILSDMREDYYIVVGVTSWDDYYDYPTEHTQTLPRIKVKKAFYDRLSQNNGVLASYSKTGIFGGLSVKTNPRKDWEILRIDPKKWLYRGDDSAEFWIQDAPVEYFHKYILITDGEKEETDWVKVDEATYEKYYNDLGMSIVTKPYGYYESEKIDVATPPGMAFVNNDKYGEWRQDSSGHSFWHYYGIYSFLGGHNNRYYRSDYNSYRGFRGGNRNRGYYGRNNSYGTFGTRSFAGSNSSNMRKRMSSSGFKRSSRNVKSAGRGSRGRGPGGGGK